MNHGAKEKRAFSLFEDSILTGFDEARLRDARTILARRVAYTFAALKCGEEIGLK